MYHVLENTTLTEKEAAVLYREFLKIRKRLQQIVVLYVATAKTALQQATGDLIMASMREAAQTPVRRSAFNCPLRGLPTLAKLDQQIVNGLLADEGIIQLGCAPTFFRFTVTHCVGDLVGVEESVYPRDEGYKNTHPAFFEQMGEALLTPATDPIDTLKHFGYA